MSHFCPLGGDICYGALTGPSWGHFLFVLYWLFLLSPPSFFLSWCRGQLHFIVWSHLGQLLLPVSIFCGCFLCYIWFASASAFQKTQTDIPDILCTMTHKSLRSGCWSLADVWRHVATDSINNIFKLLQRGDRLQKENPAKTYCKNYLRRVQSLQFVDKSTRKSDFPILSLDMISKMVNGSSREGVREER